jgi:hypothetical protein
LLLFDIAGLTSTHVAKTLEFTQMAGVPYVVRAAFDGCHHSLFWNPGDAQWAGALDGVLRLLELDESLGAERDADVLMHLIVRPGPTWSDGGGPVLLPARQHTLARVAQSR